MEIESSEHSEEAEMSTVYGALTKALVDSTRYLQHGICEVGIAIISILQIRKLSHFGEIDRLAPGHRTREWQSLGLNFRLFSSQAHVPTYHTLFWVS